MPVVTAEHSTNRPRTGRRTLSWTLLGLGAVLFALAGLAGWLNTTLANTDHFAEYANKVRQNQAVGEQLGILVGGAAVDADPDLIAIRPAIQGAAAMVLTSSALDGSFQAAIRSGHAALTTQGSQATVLALADLGATLTGAMEKFLPDLAAQLPPDLSTTLADVGGQSGIAARIIPLVNTVRTLAWVLPLLALLAMAAGIWAAPRRRVALIRLGWLLVGAGGFLGMVALAMALFASVAPTNTATNAIIAAAVAALTPPLVVRAVTTVLVGGLLVAAAGALLPQFSLEGQLRRARVLLSWHPQHLWSELLRALAIIGLGVLVVLFPVIAAQLLMIVGGLIVFFVGIAQLDKIAERYVASEAEAASGGAGPAGVAEAGQGIADAEHEIHSPGRGMWVIPLAAGTVIAAVFGLIMVPGALPQETPQPAGSTVDPDACNGHVELCDRSYSEVAYPASHNSMAAADEKGWFLAEQPTGIVKSLDDGIRVLLVDTWYGQATASGSVITAPRSIDEAEKQLGLEFGAQVSASLRRTIDRVRREPGVGPVEPYFCHTVCEIGATKVAPVLAGVKKWLDENPREVLTWFIQDTVTPADTAGLFAEAGLADMTYTHQIGTPWPTLREMIDSGRRVVVLMENQSGGTQYPWLMAGFEQSQDTPYSFATVADFNCDPNRGPADAPILLVNHWLASFSHLVTNAEKANQRDVLLPRVQQCQKTRQFPNYIAVNWYNLGDVFGVVDELNKVG